MDKEKPALNEVNRRLKEWNEKAKKLIEDIDKKLITDISSELAKHMKVFLIKFEKINEENQKNPLEFSYAVEGIVGTFITFINNENLNTTQHFLISLLRTNSMMLMQDKVVDIENLKKEEDNKPDYVG